MAEEKTVRTQNPIIARLLKPGFWLQVGIAVALWIGIIVVGCNISIAITLKRVGSITPRIYWMLSSDPGMVILVWGSLTAAILSPLLVAMLSVIQMSHFVRSQEYTLLGLSNLSKRELLVGQMLTVLFNLRFYLALACGLLPIVGTLGQYILFDAWFWYSPSSGFQPCFIAPLQNPLALCSQHIVLPAWLPFNLSVWVTSMIYIHLLAIALGVELIFWRKKSSEAIIGASLILVVAMLVAGLISLAVARFYPVESDLQDATMIVAPLVVGVFVGWLRLRRSGYGVMPGRLYPLCARDRLNVRCQRSAFSHKKNQ